MTQCDVYENTVDDADAEDNGNKNSISKLSRGSSWEFVVGWKFDTCSPHERHYAYYEGKDGPRMAKSEAGYIWTRGRRTNTSTQLAWLT